MMILYKLNYKENRDEVLLWTDAKQDVAEGLWKQLVSEGWEEPEKSLVRMLVGTGHEADILTPTNLWP